jgi:hypothetical protein
LRQLRHSRKNISEGEAFRVDGSRDLGAVPFALAELDETEAELLQSAPTTTDRAVAPEAWRWGHSPHRPLEKSRRGRHAA